DEERTEAQYLVNPWGSSDEDRLYRTGDLGRYLSDGQVIFAGRVDRQVKLRGHRLELPEVEACLNTFNQVAQSVVRVEDDVLIGYLVPNKEATETKLSAAKLRAFMAERLPTFMIPSRFMALDHIPLTVNGKVDHQALPALAEHLESAPGSRPLNQTEKAVSDIFKEVLGLPHVNRDDNFFEIGGSSVQAVQTCYKLQERFSTDLPAIKIFEHPTVEALTRLLSATDESEEPQTAESDRLESRRQQVRQRRRSRQRVA
ncbi:MAG: phosphopantetheine-binding protein, partial [Acidobacteriota bacterium]